MQKGQILLPQCRIYRQAHYFDENSDILKVMHEDHTRARGIVQAIFGALEHRDQKTINDKLMAYGELLSEQIRKEDEILYPWIDTRLSTRQAGELLVKFNEADRQIGIAPEKYEDFIDQLEQKAIAA